MMANPGVLPARAGQSEGLATGLRSRARSDSATPFANRSRIAEAQTCLTAGVLRGESARQICVFFMGEVGFDLFGEILIFLGPIR